MFYDQFYRLCLAKGVTPTQVARDLELRQSTVSMWKMQGTTPRYDTLRKLADYFGVDVDDLLVETYGIVAGGKIEAGGGIKSRYGIKTGGGIKAGGTIEIGPMVYGEQARANRAMEQMTEEGRSKVADYAEDILPRYRAETVPESTLDSTECKDTTPPPDAPETAPEGE